MTAGQGLLFALYLVCSIALASYGVHGLVLVALFGRRRRAVAAAQAEVVRGGLARWPTVTTQLPLYNEAAVAERVLRAAAALDYPAGLHEIQVLDDSDDECRAVVDRVAGELTAAGVDVQVVRRPGRDDYKAGALRVGMERARGELLAIFDADFEPAPDFLRRTVPLLVADGAVGCVQGRWEHLNRDRNWLTRALSVGIDGHFAVEQGARAWNGLYMNFNGTAGVWRRAAIESAGGWQGDTITEDLDLSYRAQLTGWRIAYAFDASCPAEIPETVDALKSQQRRWARGSIQTARKLLPAIWRGRDRLGRKLAATFHLTHYSVGVWMTLMAILTFPVLLWVPLPRIGPWLWAAWSIVLLAAASPCISYWAAGRALGHPSFTLRHLPALVVLGSGLSLNNGLAALGGLFGGPVPFVRTPKSGASARTAGSRRYRAPLSRLWWVEILLGVYCLAALGLYLTAAKWLIGVFLAFYSAGYLALGWASRPRPVAARADRRTPAGEPALAASRDGRR